MKDLSLTNTPANRSHYKTSSIANKVEKISKKIVDRGDLPHASVQSQLNILYALCDFSLGRHILESGGANGFWTDYMVNHPNNGKLTGLNSDGKPFTDLEEFFLNECPIVIAHQERFAIFQQQLQIRLKDNIVLASVPCGLMRELLTLDFSGTNNYQLIGVDIDSESLTDAAKLARNKGIYNIHFFQMDAWEMTFNNEFDAIASSGLNVYESDSEKLLDLYKRFYKSLKPGGALIISVLTYPPSGEKNTDWNIEAIPSNVLIKDQILHEYVLDIKWRNFRTISELDTDFKKVGFVDISIHFDKNRVFPTVVARKPG